MSSLVSDPRSLPWIAYWRFVSSPSVCVSSALGCWQPMWISVLWRILALRGISPKLVNLISGLYSGTEIAIKCDSTIFDYFLVNTGVLGCVLAPTLFNTCMDHVLERMISSFLTSFPEGVRRDGLIKPRCPSVRPSTLFV